MRISVIIPSLPEHYGGQASYENYGEALHGAKVSQVSFVLQRLKAAPL